MKLIQGNNFSGFKGVSLDRRNGNFRTRIMVNHKPISVGSFPTAKDAAIAYNEAAKKYHGEFACLNDV